MEAIDNLKNKKASLVLKNQLRMKGTLIQIDKFYNLQFTFDMKQKKCVSRKIDFKIFLSGKYLFFFQI